MGGKACIRDLRISVGTIVALVATGARRARIFSACRHSAAPPTQAGLISTARHRQWIEAFLGQAFAA